MLITAVCTLARIKRILIQGENGYSAVARGGYTRTVSMMMLMPVANCAPFVELYTLDTIIQSCNIDCIKKFVHNSLNLTVKGRQGLCMG